MTGGGVHSVQELTSNHSRKLARVALRRGMKERREMEDWQRDIHLSCMASRVSRSCTSGGSCARTAESTSRCIRDSRAAQTEPKGFGLSKRAQLGRLTHSLVLAAAATSAGAAAPAALHLGTATESCGAHVQVPIC